MSEFVLHPEAYSDLKEIWEYVADESPEAGDRLIEEIFATIRSLVPFPHVGHVRSELTKRPLRFHLVREYLIAYAPDEKPLVVIGVLHGRRSPRVIAAVLGRRS
jgi:plasmid stabilization system protein ParE